MVGGLAGFASGQNQYLLILNSASRAAVTSTGASSSNCSTGGLVGYLTNNTNGAVLANSVNLGNNLIQNTAAAANLNIGGIVGFVDAATVRNCYALRATGTMKYKNGTVVPTTSGSAYGGVFGQITNSAVVKDCYYRCTEAGKDNGIATTNYTRLTYAQMTSQEATVTVTVTPIGTLKNKYFRIPLAFGASTASSGNVTEGNLVTFTASNGETVKMNNWTTPPSASLPDYPLPSDLYDLGPDYYSN